MKIEFEGIKSFIEEYGIKDSLVSLAEIMDKRSYFAIEDYEIKRKMMNLALPAAAFFPEDIDLVSKAMEDSVDRAERQIILKIDRMSNLSLEKLEENFFKLLYKNNFEHSLKYGNELFLRDKSKFFKVAYKFAFMDNPKLRKPMLVAAFEKLDMEEDEIIYLLISYLTKARSDFSIYESATTGEKTLEELKAVVLSLKEKLYTVEGLDLIQYLHALENYPEKNKKFYEVLENRIEFMKKSDNKIVSSVEKAILEFYIKELSNGR
ncbi:MAG: hypothetical protein ACRC0V_09095 [Fusobacteriaceae bacterium]